MIAVHAPPTDPLDNPPFKPLKVGEYDIVNISLIGYDPITRRSFEECREEWKAAMDVLNAEIETLKWWQLRRRFRIASAIAAMDQRQGMQGYSF